MEFRKGDRIVLDSAPLVASPTATGRAVTATVVHDAPADAQQVYISSDGGSILYVAPKWIKQNVTQEARDAARR